MKQFKQLEYYCNDTGLRYRDLEDERFDKYFHLLVETNEQMNLTSITEKDEVEIKHFIDSLAAADVIRHTASEERKKVIDIGSGAGFPGIPLAIMLPDVNFTLVDALNKRTNFISDVCKELQLTNVETFQARAEEIGQGDLRETYDFCISRAVADMAVLAEYCLPMVSVGGYAIFYKSGNYQDELTMASNAIELLGGKIEDVRQFDLTGTEMKRSLIIVYKGKATPDKYPRRPGKPSKSPIMNK